MVELGHVVGFDGWNCVMWQNWVMWWEMKVGLDHVVGTDCRIWASAGIGSCGDSGIGSCGGN